MRSPAYNRSIPTIVDDSCSAYTVVGPAAATCITPGDRRRIPPRRRDFGCGRYEILVQAVRATKSLDPRRCVIGVGIESSRVRRRPRPLEELLDARRERVDPQADVAALVEVVALPVAGAEPRTFAVDDKQL